MGNTPISPANRLRRIAAEQYEPETRHISRNDFNGLNSAADYIERLETTIAELRLSWFSMDKTFNQTPIRALRRQT